MIVIDIAVDISTNQRNTRYRLSCVYTFRSKVVLSKGTSTITAQNNLSESRKSHGPTALSRRKILLSMSYLRKVY